MGEAVGADLVDMGWIQLMPLFPVSGGGIPVMSTTLSTSTKKVCAMSTKITGVMFWHRRL